MNIFKRIYMKIKSNRENENIQKELLKDIDEKSKEMSKFISERMKTNNEIRCCYSKILINDKNIVDEDFYGTMNDFIEKSESGMKAFLENSAVLRECQECIKKILKEEKYDIAILNEKLREELALIEKNIELLSIHCQASKKYLDWIKGKC